MIEIIDRKLQQHRDGTTTLFLKKRIGFDDLALRFGIYHGMIEADAVSFPKSCTKRIDKEYHGSRVYTKLIVQNKDLHKRVEATKTELGKLFNVYFVSIDGREAVLWERFENKDKWFKEDDKIVQILNIILNSSYAGRLVCPTIEQLADMYQYALDNDLYEIAVSIESRDEERMTEAILQYTCNDFTMKFKIRHVILFFTDTNEFVPEFIPELSAQ